MIKKTINPFMIIYVIFGMIGFSLANVFLRKRLINEMKEQQNLIDFLKNEIDKMKVDSKEVIMKSLSEMEVEELMEIISLKRGFSCACIDTEVLKKLLNGENPEANDLQM